MKNISIFALRLIRLIRRRFRPKYRVIENIHYCVTEPIAKITCGENEVMIFRVSERMSFHQMEELRSQFKSKFGDAKYMITTGVDFLGVFPKQ